MCLQTWEAVVKSKVSTTVVTTAAAKAECGQHGANCAKSGRKEGGDSVRRFSAKKKKALGKKMQTLSFRTECVSYWKSCGKLSRAEL